MANNTSSAVKEKEPETSYEYEGYHVRVHFTGTKTLKECMLELVEQMVYD